MAAQDTYICRTDIGEIEISRSALAHVILNAVNAMDGHVLLTSKKGKLQNGGRFGNTDPADLVDIEIEGDAILIRLHLIMRFGRSMQKTSDSLSEMIRSGIRKVTGLSPATVIIHVTGTLSRRVAPRDIEYRTDYED